MYTGTIYRIYRTYSFLSNACKTLRTTSAWYPNSYHLRLQTPVVDTIVDFSITTVTLPLPDINFLLQSSAQALELSPTNKYCSISYTSIKRFLANNFYGIFLLNFDSTNPTHTNLSVHVVTVTSLHINSPVYHIRNLLSKNCSCLYIHISSCHIHYIIPTKSNFIFKKLYTIFKWANNMHFNFL